MPRKISEQSGLEAVRKWRDSAERAQVARSDLATAVRYVLQNIQASYPGQAVELRVPPFAAVQFLSGVNHRRGTPPAVVQLSAHTLLELALGEAIWQDAVKHNEVIASGERSDLSQIFPLKHLMKD